MKNVLILGLILILAGIVFAEEGSNSPDFSISLEVLKDNDYITNADNFRIEFNTKGIDENENEYFVYLYYGQDESFNDIVNKALDEFDEDNGKYYYDWNISELVEGKYKLKAEIKKGEDSNSDISIKELQIDRTKPQINSFTLKLEDSEGENYNSEDWTDKDIYIEVEAADNEEGAGINKVLVLKEDEEIKELEEDNGKYTGTISIEGDYNIKIKVYDKAGNSEESEEKEIKIDKAPPVYSLKAHAENLNGDEYTFGNWINKNIYIELKDVKDNGIGIKENEGNKEIKYILDGEEGYFDYDNDNNVYYVLIEDEGTHTFNIKIEDKLGKTAEWDENKEIKIDKTKPVVNDKYLYAEADNCKINLNFNSKNDAGLTDNLSGWGKTLIYMQKDSGNITLKSTITNSDTDEKTYTGLDADHTYTFYLSYCDKAGNCTDKDDIKSSARTSSGTDNSNNTSNQTQNTNYNTDTTPPEIEFKNIKTNDEISGVFKIEIEAKDGTLTITPETLVFYLDNEQIENTDGKKYAERKEGEKYIYEFEIDTKQWSDGEYELKAKAMDRAGNYGYKTIKIKISNEKINKEKLKQLEDDLKGIKEKVEELKNMDLNTEKIEEKINKLEEKIADAEQEVKNSKKFEEEEKQAAETIKEIKETIKEKEKDNAEESKDNKEFKEKRKVKIIEIEVNGEKKTKIEFAINMENTGKEKKEISVVEKIPKEIAEDADLIKSKFDFEIIKKDPVLAWKMELNAGESKEITYYIVKETEKNAEEILEMFKEMPEIYDAKTPLSALETEEGVKKIIVDGKENQNSTGFISLAGSAFAGIIIFVLIIGMAYYVINNQEGKRRKGKFAYKEKKGFF